MGKRGKEGRVKRDDLVVEGGHQKHFDPGIEDMLHAAEKKGETGRKVSHVAKTPGHESRANHSRSKDACRPSDSLLGVLPRCLAVRLLKVKELLGGRGLKVKVRPGGPAVVQTDERTLTDTAHAEQSALRAVDFAFVDEAREQHGRYDAPLTVSYDKDPIRLIEGFDPVVPFHQIVVQPRR